MPQQKIGHAGVKVLCQGGHGVEIVQHSAVAIRLGKVTVIVFGADGTAVTQMVVAGNKDASPGQILGQRLVTVDEFHHAVGKLHDGTHLALRDTAERVERPPGHGGGQGEVDRLAHEVPPLRAGITGC